MRAVISQGRRDICRAFSTSRIVADSQHSRLPPARLRAIISLYHHSSSFITPTTLSDRIDLAFADQANSSQLVSTNPTSHSELRARLYAKQHENKIGRPTNTVWKGMDLNLRGVKIWSDRRMPRQVLVGAALWGTEWDGKPSLETVQETTSIDKESSSQLATTDHVNHDIQ